MLPILLDSLDSLGCLDSLDSPRFFGFLGSLESLASGKFYFPSNIGGIHIPYRYAPLICTETVKFFELLYGKNKEFRAEIFIGISHVRNM